MLAFGPRIRDYEVWGRLGEGGMSEVWLAKHVLLSVPVIIKTLRALASEPAGGGLDRMLREARHMARITSPRVVRATDLACTRGSPTSSRSMWTASTSRSSTGGGADPSAWASLCGSSRTR